MRLELKLKKYTRDHFSGHKVYSNICKINVNVNNKTNIGNLKKRIVRDMKKFNANSVSWKGTILCNFIDGEYKFNDVFNSIVNNIY